ncbi:MAG TPA: thiamine pyrophosphate-dependent enzyme [Synergistales bacterium]|jgi:pyruvate ferredoxin oxidoreductase beta subunit|nr:thiamine pyrophosphate-dependent enzyme [Synergistales bacterium]MDI9392880.1 thiamine pyrophosphate-dependent enzyme [Synergistota bacterium]MDY0179602.1 thiamine pyrophosphate-dependent enzyme [Synergistaceae bacterium]HRV71163.1 thiamine pyrophosphate-dependent enzyme [Thermovirgaceae bacterium]MDD5514537.1 thiamine pyrophosphate-dependent enzyme [Synergistales bacterium]
MTIQTEVKELHAPGHRACPGCGCAIAVKLILRETGPNTIVVSPTGCLETFTSPFRGSSWEVPWIHSLFENAPAIATGVLAGLNSKGNVDGTKIVAIGGDGGTYDIGMGSLSGMFERKDDILYICYDNEAYMNTGIQGSSATPLGAGTTTTPVVGNSFGKMVSKKDLLAIALAHDVPYAATASIADPADLKKKVRKGMDNPGPAFILMLTPCNLGWGFEPENTVELARKAISTGLFPIVEFENGRLVSVQKINPVPVEEYLKPQKRYQHLYKRDDFNEVLKAIQEKADRNIEKYDLAKDRN